MGLDYSYEIIADRVLAPLLVEAVAARLRRYQAEELRSALGDGPEWLEEQDVSVGPHDPSEPLRIADMCLIFVFPADPFVVAYEDDAGMIRGEGIGCVWSRFSFGKRFVHFQATAATSRMSRLFENSPGIRSTFIEIARDSGSSAVLFDDETGNLLSVWPYEGRLPFSIDVDALTDFHARPRHQLDADAYCRIVLSGCDFLTGL